MPRIIQLIGTALALISSVIALALIAPKLGGLPDDLTIRLQTFPMIGAALLAGLLSVMVIWRAGRGPGVVEVAFGMALMCAALMLSVVPWGDATPNHRLAFGIAWGAMSLQFLFFWTRFPQRLEMAGIDRLVAAEGTSLLSRFLRTVARVSRFLIGSPLGWILATVGAVSFSWTLVGGSAVPYGLLIPGIKENLRLVDALALIGANLFIVIGVAPAVSSYRLANEEGQRRVLWILLAHLMTTFMILAALSIQVSALVTGSAVLHGIERGLNMVFLPISFTLFLAGYAMGVFRAGAFNLRPVIGRSTVYGASLLCVTFLFAGVEEVAENVMVARVGLPEGVGTWIGAATIAVFLGPIRDRIALILKKVTHGASALEP